MNLVYCFLDMFLDDVYVMNNLFDVYKIIFLNFVGNCVFVFFDFISNFINFKELDVLGNGLVYIMLRIGDFW